MKLFILSIGFFAFAACSAHVQNARTETTDKSLERSVQEVLKTLDQTQSLVAGGLSPKAIRN